MEHAHKGAMWAATNKAMGAKLPKLFGVYFSQLAPCAGHTDTGFNVCHVGLALDLYPLLSILFWNSSIPPFWNENDYTVPLYARSVLTFTQESQLRLCLECQKILVFQQCWNSGSATLEY